MVLTTSGRYPQGLFPEGEPRGYAGKMSLILYKAQFILQSVRHNAVLYHKMSLFLVFQFDVVLPSVLPIEY